MQAKKVPFWLKIVGVGLAGLLFAPIALYTLTGLFALGVAAILAMTGIFLGPVLAEKMANWKMLGLQKEWAENPIPTLERQLIQKREDLKARKKNLEEFSASVNSVKSSNDEYKRVYPNNTDKIARLDEAYAKLNAGLERKVARYKAVKQAINNFEAAIQEADLFWKASLAVHRSAALDEKDEDPMELVKTRTSLGAVVQSMDLAFAELDSALLDEEDPSPMRSNVVPALEVQEIAVLPASISGQTTKEEVKNRR